MGFFAAAIGLLTGALLFRMRRAVACARHAESAAHEARESAIRLLRLAANDLRGHGLTLLGHGEQTGDTISPALLGLSRRLLDLSEDLLDQTEAPDAPRILREERLPLGPLAEAAVAALVAQLGPGQRAWRISPTLDPVILRADRRALHQVLIRVLAAAAASTGDGDWIELCCHTDAANLVLAIEDEGAGRPLSREDATGRQSRGLGLGLVLARGLMQAHGGSLTLISNPGIGTRAELRLPLSRLLPPDHSQISA